MVGKRIAQYQILEKLGQGGMGEVFLAEDSDLHRKVALKFFPESSSADAQALDRFKQEARASAALNHPNITTIYEVGVFEDRPYIAMAYIDGEKLTDIVGRHDRDLEQSLDIIIQICNGLRAAHEAGIVHRDVKPDNILVDKDGRVKILDFGVAKLRGRHRLPDEISTVGTAYYMAPEQIGGGEVDNRSDVFSLGVVLYELVTGQRPFKGEHTAAVFYSITNEDPAPLATSGLKAGQKEELNRIAMKALAKDPAQRYQNVNELETELIRFRDGAHDFARRARRRRVAILAPVVVAAAVIALLLVKPFKLELSTNGGVEASGNTLAVMYFENLVDREDPQRIGEIVTNLMITDLSESPYLSVVSSQRLYDLLKSAGKEDAKVIDKTTASRIATRADAKWMLQGNILQTEPNYVLTSQLVDVASGNVVASQHISGRPGESIFEMVDRLSREARQDLSVPASPRGGDETDVADVTTHSVDAYRAYLIGLEKQNKFFMKEARQWFKKAVDLDSTFAMAYLRLSDDRVAGTYAEKKRALEKAVRHSDRASKKEILYIKNAAAEFNGDSKAAIAGYETITDLYPNEKEAYFKLGQLYRDSNRELDRAIQAFEKVISIDPLDKNAYNQLAYVYNFAGDFEKSIWAINQYINLAKDEPNPYDSRADLYAYNGSIDEAIESYQKAIQMKPDFFPSLLKLGHMAVFQDDYDTAAAYYDRVSGKADEAFSRWARTCRAYLPLYRGEFQTALDSLEAELERERREGYDGLAHTKKLYDRTVIYAALGDFQRAIEAAEEYRDEYRRLRPTDDEWWRLMYGYLMYYCQQTDKAEEMLGSFLTNIDGLDEAKMMGYAALKGLLEMQNGRPDAACAYLERANGNIKLFGRQYWLGRAYLEANQPKRAATVFDDMLYRYSEERAEIPLTSIRAWYYAGLAYENAGEIEKARTCIDRFLKYWGDADPAPPEVSDARSRLELLTRNP